MLDIFLLPRLNREVLSLKEDTPESLRFSKFEQARFVWQVQSAVV
jgi:hypothetical protein